jgi:hypothetical protein
MIKRSTVAGTFSPSGDRIPSIHSSVALRDSTLTHGGLPLTQAERESSTFTIDSCRDCRIDALLHQAQSVHWLVGPTRIEPLYGPE